MSTGALPVDLLEEIFSKLPVKSLISLTIICKSWLALISSQSFVKTHLLKYHLDPNSHLLLLHRPCRDTITISELNFLGFPRITVTPIPVAENPPPLTPMTAIIAICSGRKLPVRQESKSCMLRLVGLINGLVCFSTPTLRPTNVVIWNPATDRFKDVAVSHLNYSNPLRIYVAFGFDCVGDDYKVVCIYRFRLRNNPEMSFRFRMYSCRDASWKDLVPGFEFSLGFIMGCVSVKGNPFWMGFYKEREIWLTLDVQTEVIRMFSGPLYLKNVSTSTSIMALMYAIKSIRLSMPVHLECYMDGKVVIKDRVGELFTYDLESEEIKDLGVGEGMEAHYMAINYIESLVAIEGMEKVKEEAGQEGQDTELAANDRDAPDAMMLEKIE